MTPDPAKFWAYVDKSAGEEACWPWLRGFFEQGYGCVVWGTETRGAHTVAYELENGRVPKGVCVLHSCDNRPCCNPKHLSAGSKADNAADAKSKDRHTRGARHSLAKLSDEDVAMIRERYVKYDREHGMGAIAREYKVSKQCVWLALKGKSWAHVQ